MKLLIKVTYTDGTWIEADISEWQDLRGDGVDRVEVGGRSFFGHALYWVYFDQADGGAWVVGGASTYASPPPAETLFRVDGRPLIMRGIVTLPDLMHSQVKLGWWKRPTVQA